MTMPIELPIKTTDPVLKAPTVYADQMAQVAVGPWVTKITFGMARAPGEPPEPSHSVVIPTPAARELALNILRILENKDAKQHFGAEVQAFIDSIGVARES